MSYQLKKNTWGPKSPLFLLYLKIVWYLSMFDFGIFCHLLRFPRPGIWKVSFSLFFSSFSFLSFFFFYSSFSLFPPLSGASLAPGPWTLSIHHGHATQSLRHCLWHSFDVSKKRILFWVILSMAAKAKWLADLCDSNFLQAWYPMIFLRHIISKTRRLYFHLSFSGSRFLFQGPGFCPVEEGWEHWSSVELDFGVLLYVLSFIGWSLWTALGAFPILLLTSSVQLPFWNMVPSIGRWSSLLALYSCVPLMLNCRFLYLVFFLSNGLNFGFSYMLILRCRFENELTLDFSSYIDIYMGSNSMTISRRMYSKSLSLPHVTLTPTVVRNHSVKSPLNLQGLK